MKGGTLFTIIIILKVAHQSSRTNRSLPLDPSEMYTQPSGYAYAELPLVQSKFKNKNLAGVSWYDHSRLDRGTERVRHLEWLDGSDPDHESAASSEKGILADLFGENEDTKKVAYMDDEDLRQHRRRKYVKVHRVLLPLLIAYKLKFFTMIPILVGALVLLVYTTGLAGFFFALFAAAAGLHVKSSPTHH